MCDRGYRISSRRADGSKRVGIAFSLLVNDVGKFFLPVPAPHANDGGEITIENAKKGQVKIAVPTDEGRLLPCCGFVAIPVDPFSLLPVPNLRPPAPDSAPPAILTEAHVGDIGGQIARTRFRYDLCNPTRTELGTLIHLTKVAGTLIPLGSLCTSGLTDWGVVAAVDRGGRAVVATLLTTVLTGFSQHGLHPATAEDINRAFTTEFGMSQYARPADVDGVQAVFKLAETIVSGEKTFVAGGSELTFDDFMNTLECIGKNAPLLVKKQDLPPALAKYAMKTEVDLYDENGPLGHLWINYAEERVALREQGDEIPITEISAAAFMQEVRSASAA